MFPRAERLRKRRDIQRTLAKGRRVSDQFLLVRTMPLPVSGPRVTVVVGTVVDKRATVRNRIKRQLRVDLRKELAARPPLSSGLAIMVSVKRPILQCSPTARKASLQALLSRSGL